MTSSLPRVLPDGPAARSEAVKLLRAGLIVAVPTDTVYGIAADLALPDAIERLFAAKRRPPEKAVAVLLADADQAETLAILGPAARALGDRFWPGGLTLVLPVRPGATLPRVLAAGTPTIGVRVPDHDAPRAIARALGPLPTTSANVSGEPDARDAGEIAARLGDAVALVIDGGAIHGGPASTVVDCTSDLAVIRREGAIPAALIAAGAGGGRAAPRDRAVAGAQGGSRAPQASAMRFPPRPPGLPEISGRCRSRSSASSAIGSARPAGAGPPAEPSGRFHGGGAMPQRGGPASPNPGPTTRGTMGTPLPRPEPKEVSAVSQTTVSSAAWAPISEVDPELWAAMEAERHRQTDKIELIASENYVFAAVNEAQGSWLTNKYAEGLPGKRYYGGCEYVDVAENLAQDRALALFPGAEHVNVQPHSGRPGQHGRLLRGAPARRPDPGHEPRPRRPPHPWLAGQLLRAAVRGPRLRRATRETERIDYDVARGAGGTRSGRR